MDKQQTTQVTTTKRISTKLVATIAIIAVALLTFIIGGLLILANNNKINNNSADNGTTPTTTPTPNDLAQCEYEGITYESGQSFDKGDSCNTCSCEDGRVSCEEKTCSIEFSHTINQYFLNGGINYTFNLKGVIPQDSQVNSEQDFLELGNSNYRILITSSSEGTERYLTYQPKITSVGGYTRINYDSSLQLNMPEDKSNQILDSFAEVFVYGNSFKTDGCRNSIGGVEIYACGDDWINIPFQEDSSSQPLRVLCGVNSKNTVTHYCDQIILSLEVRKIN